MNASCDEEVKPAVKARCNLGLCTRWNTGQWTPVGYLQFDLIYVFPMVSRLETAVHARSYFRDSRGAVATNKTAF